MTGPRRLPRWIFIGGGALLLLIAGLLLVPFLVPVDHFRPLIVRLAEDATGRKVEIDALRLHLLPAIHLQVVNLRVSNPEGFPSGDTLAVKSVDIGTTLGSVVARRLDVTGVVFNGLQVNLLDSVRGRSNYDFSGGVKKPAGAHAAAPKNAPAFSVERIDSVTARNVTITSGTYDPVRRQVVPAFAVAGLNIRVGGINLKAQNWLDSLEVAGGLGGVRLSDGALSKPLQFQKGSFTVRGRRAQATFAAALDTLRAEGTVTVANLKNPVAEFEMTLPEVDVDRARALVPGVKGGGTPFGPGGPGRLIARGSLRIGRLIARPLDASAVTSQITLFTNKADIHSFSLTAFGGAARGSASVEYGTPRMLSHLSAQVRGVDLGAMMKAIAPAGQQGITGKLDLDARVATAMAPDPLDALSAAGTFALRDATIPGLSKPVEIPRGSFSVSGGGARATFAAALDTLRAEGTIRIASLKNPSADFDISVPELDVDHARSLMAGGKDGASPRGSGGPQRLLAKGALKIGRLIARPLEVSSVTAQTEVYTDKVAVDSYGLSLYGGTARGTAAADYASANQPAQATAQVRGVDFSRLMAAVAPAAGPRITGTFEADGRVATALAQDPLAALTGAGTFAVRNGAFPGLDIKNILMSVAKIGQAGASGSTRFRYFGGDFRLGKQRIYSNALKLDAEGLQATAQGSSGFDRTLDYTGIGNLQGSLLGLSQPELGNLSILGNTLGGTTMQSLNEYRARVPFSLKGTFDNPKFAAAGVPEISRGSAPAKQQPKQPAQPGENPIQNPIKLLPFPLGP